MTLWFEPAGQLKVILLEPPLSNLAVTFSYARTLQVTFHISQLWASNSEEPQLFENVLNQIRSILERLLLQVKREGVQ